MASLTAEVVRAAEDTHTIYEQKMGRIAELIARGLAGVAAEQRAWGLLGVLTGGLNIVRAMQSTEAADHVAAAIRRSVLEAGGATQAVR